MEAAIIAGIAGAAAALAAFGWIASVRAHRITRTRLVEADALAREAHGQTQDELTAAQRLIAELRQQLQARELLAGTATAEEPVRAPAPALLIPPFSTEAPGDWPDDDSSTDRRFGPILARGLNFDVMLDYVNAAGEESSRRLTVRRLHGALHDPRAIEVRYVGGWCHLRHELRTFRTDRILGIACAETGEVPANPGAWLLSRAGIVAPEDDGPEPASVFPPVRARLVRPTPALTVWQRSPGDLETFDVEIHEVHQRGVEIVGFRARAQRHRSATDRAWTGDKTFDLDLADGDGVLTLEFDGQLMEQPEEIASWLAQLPAEGG